MKNIALKIIIFLIRKYFKDCIIPSYIGQTVVTYRFYWSASAQDNDTSYSDLTRYYMKLKTETYRVGAKIKEIDKSVGINSDMKIGNYLDAIKKLNES